VNRQIRLSDYKLIVFDIDGTIQDSNHQLHPFTKEVLLKLHNTKIPFTLATGKNLPAVKPLAEILGIKIPLVLSNGCMLQTVDGKVLEKYVLPLELTRQVIEICNSGGWDLAIYLNDGIYIKKINHNLELLIDYGTPVLIEVGEWSNIDNRLVEAHKCLAVERSSPRGVYELEAIFEKELRGKVEFCHSLEDILEVMPKGVSKLSAITKVADMLGIGMKDVMTFGDGNNDVEMLEGAGLGIALQNGSEMAKASANITIASCDENGPAEFLNQLIEQYYLEL
jgi:Cof subfamily protein (haloacid dehalogenase superfamily)